MESAGGYAVTMDGRSYDVKSERILPGLYSLLVGGESYEVSVYSPEADTYNVHLHDGMRRVQLLSPIGLVLKGQGGGASAQGLSVRAPMPGKVVRVLVSVGQKVSKGDGVIVVEAMKMQNEMQALSGGIVKEVRAREGDTVEGGAELVILEAE